MLRVLTFANPDQVLVLPFEDDQADSRVLICRSLLWEKHNVDVGVDGAAPSSAAVHAYRNTYQHPIDMDNELGRKSFWHWNGTYQSISVCSHRFDPEHYGLVSVL